MSYRFQNERPAAAKKGLRPSWMFIYGLHPWYAWLSRYPRELKPEGFIEALGYNPTVIESYENGLKDIIIDIASKVTEYVGKMHRSPGAIDRDQAVLLYLLIRLNEPKVVVETGVGQGVSTAFLLKGLHDNGKGQLLSIDLPFYEGRSNIILPPDEIYPIPKGLRPGWMVPDYLRDRWELLQGNTEDLLGPLLGRLGSIDLFLQDDLHKYKHMLSEFRMAWRCMSEGGMLISHDWEKNPALCQFALEWGLPLIKCCRLGCISRLFVGRT